MHLSKKNKRLLGLVIVLAAAIIVTLIVRSCEEKQEKIKTSNEVVLEIPEDTVKVLSWNTGSDTLTFAWDGENWIYEEDESFPADPDKIASLLEEFEAFESAFIIEDVKDYSQYGLDDPVGTIEITTTEKIDGLESTETSEDEVDTAEEAEADEEDTDSADSDNSEESSTGTLYTYTITMGDYSTMDSQRYVSIGDGNVYLAVSDPLDLYEVTLSDLILDDEIPYFETIDTITFEGLADYTIYRDEDSTSSLNEDDVYFTKVDGAEEPLNTTSVNAYGISIYGMDREQYVTYNATQEELKQYGMDDPELTVTIGYTYTDDDDKEQSDTFVLHVSRNAEEAAALEEANARAEEEGDEDYEPEEISGYVRVGDSSIIYEISSDTYDKLAAVSYDDLRHTEVFNADFDDVTKLEIILDGKQYDLNRNGDEDSSEDKEEDSEDAEETADESEDETSEETTTESTSLDGSMISMDDFQSALEALTITEFTDQSADDKEEIALNLYLDNENNSCIRIVLYRYDGEYCLAEVDGQMIGLVNRSDVVDLVETVNSIVLTKTE